MATLREALRSLRRTPLFTATGILSLAVGVGLLTSVFAVAQAALFTPPPYRDPSRLVEVMATESPKTDQVSDAVPYARLRRWVRRDFRTLAELAAHGEASLALQGEEGPSRVAAQVVLGDYFGVLGVSAERGRVLTAADDRPGAAPAAVVSDAFWRERLSGDPHVLGRVLRLSGIAYTVVGVMPARFARRALVWVPAAPIVAAGSGEPVLWGVARLRAGASPEAATRELQQIAGAAFAADSTAFGGEGAAARPLGTMARNGSRAGLWMIAAVVGAVFLLGLTNLTNLFLVRTARRGHALAVRAALGADRWELGRGPAAEGALLGLAGAACGVPLAAWGTRLVGAFVAAGDVPPGGPALGARAVAFGALLGVLAALFLGLEPLRRLGGLDVRELLQRSSTLTTMSRGERRTRNVMVASQVAVCVVLLAATGALTAAIRAFAALDVGYDADRVVEALPDYGLSRTSLDAQWGLARGVAERMRARPDQAGVALFELTEEKYPGRPEWDAVYDGAPRKLGLFDRLYRGYFVNPGFFEAMGIPLVRGRGFGPGDDAGSPAVGIITARGARVWWPGQDAIGHRLKLGEAGPWITVVGVVDDVRILGWLGRLVSIPGRSGRQRPALPEIFLPAAQRGAPPPGWSQATGWKGSGGCAGCDGVVIAARTADPADVGATARALREQIATLAPALPLRFVGTMLDHQTRGGGSRLLYRNRELTSAAVGLGLLLAVLGIFAVTADAVTRRTREIGIRMALGARGAAVLRAVARESVLTSAAGLAVGAVVVVAADAVLSKLLLSYVPGSLGGGVAAPATLAAAAGAMLLVGLVAALAGAWRALRLDPAEALRSE